MKKGQKMKLTKVAAALSAVLLFGCDDITPNSTDSDSGSGTDSGIDSGTDTGTDSGSGSETGSGTNLAAQILDTLTDDGGELRVKLADAAQVSEIVSGQVSATLQLQLDSDTTISSEEAKNTSYVSLYSAGTSSTNLHGDIIFASNGVIKQRDENGDQIEVEGATYTEGDVIDFVAKWDETTYSFSVDGGATFFGPYASRDTTPVTVISFKLGDTSGQSNHEFNVDDVVIEDAGLEVFSDNFDAYTEGESLNPELNADAIYNKSSSEATVQIVSFGTGPTDGGSTETTSTQVAAITDTLGDDTGELRYKLGSTLVEGQVNVSLLYDLEEDLSAYVTVYSDGGTSTSNQIADLKLDDGKVSLRGITVEDSSTLTTFTPGEWVDVQINWITDGTGVADVTFSIDDAQIGDTYEITYDTDEDIDFVGTGAEVVSIRYVDNSGTTAYTLHADDLSITDGTSEIFADDFESYTIGEVLEGSEDDYNNNSSEATVVAQPE